MTYFQALSAAGFAATALSYGPARMGFGLFVPEFRAEFSLLTSAVGFISGLAFSGFFIGLLIAQALLSRRGPSSAILSGLLAATLGLSLVSVASGIAMLAFGVLLAASSAGFAWTPFNDAVHRKVRGPDRPGALSEISTGTSIGVACAGIAAFVASLTGVSWRYCWGLFAIAGAMTLIGNWLALRPVEKAPKSAVKGEWKTLLQTRAIPLFVISFVFGTTSAIFISFAADHVKEAGGVAGLPSESAPALIFIIYGVAGLTGLATARARAATGLLWLLRLLMGGGSLSLVLVALLPSYWPGAALSSTLQGVYVMMTSAVLAFWSEQLFPTLPSLSFTGTLMAMAAGCVLGPIFAGLWASSLGPTVMFLAAAALPAATAVLLRRGHVHEDPLVA